MRIVAWEPPTYAALQLGGGQPQLGHARGIVGGRLGGKQPRHRSRIIGDDAVGGGLSDLAEIQ